MIATIIKRLKVAVWTWRQPLTKIPNDLNLPISDLFVWRSSSKWQTYFELIDIPSLFEDVKRPNQVTIVFMNSVGKIVMKKNLFLEENIRQTINVSSMIGQGYGEIGTFAVFHSHIPTIIKKCNSFLAERGYVSYCYNQSPLRSYVHGNLDAVTLNPKGEIHFLGGNSFLPREYNLQYKLESDNNYEIGLVNPTSKKHYITIKLVSLFDNKILSSTKLVVAPGGASFNLVQSDKLGHKKLIIKSRLVMARPLVFCFKNSKLDVFHG